MKKTELRNLVREVLPKTIELRHQLHRHPEIAGKEFKTAELIRKVMGETHVELLDPFLETDVIGILRGKNPGKNVTFRGDIDALPIQEKTGLPYASEVDGMMHACGHDGNTAVVLGAAMVLDKLKDRLNGSVRFLFQPGEEVVAMGKDLVAAGALENPEPDAVFAFHGFHNLPVGVISTKPGSMMAAADFFSITINGKGGHGSMPQVTIDPILTGARVVEALQSMVSRGFDPFEPVVVSICRFSGGINGNIIPDQVLLEGTTRYHNPEFKDVVPEQMEQIIKGVCHAMGASYRFVYNHNYIPVINDPETTAFVKTVAGEYLDGDIWDDLKNPSMGGEDFAYYLDRYPGTLLRLGMGMDSPPLHNAKFNFNDDALANAITMFAALALEILQ